MAPDGEGDALSGAIALDRNQVNTLLTTEKRIFSVVGKTTIFEIWYNL